MMLSRKPLLNSEAELIKDLKNRKRKAYEFIYEKYAGAINGVLINIAGYEHNEYLLQKTFIEIYKRIHEYNGNCRAFTWMRLIAIEIARPKKLHISKLEPSIWDKNAYYLAAFRGWTLDEISDELGIPIEQVSIQMKLSREIFQAEQNLVSF